MVRVFSKIRMLMSSLDIYLDRIRGYTIKSLFVLKSVKNIVRVQYIQ